MERGDGGGGECKREEGEEGVKIIGWEVLVAVSLVLGSEREMKVGLRGVMFVT